MRWAIFGYACRGAPYSIELFFFMVGSEEVASSDAFGFEAGLGGCRARPWSSHVAWIHTFCIIVISFCATTRRDDSIWNT